MSNQKKRAEKRALDQKFENRVTKREIEIGNVLKSAMDAKMPFDRKVYEAFFSGAVWADANPDPKLTKKWFAIGATVSLLSVGLGAAFYYVALLEGWL